MPIKNNSYIARLSQDHHLEMLFCERIEIGISKDVSIDRIRKYVAYFWTQHLQSHFIEEEQLLFKNIDDVFCTKGKNDHISIIEEVENIISGKSVGQHDFIHLVSAIHQHISFEERVLFPHLELLLSQEELEKIQENLRRSHLDSFSDNFEDEFWNQNDQHMLTDISFEIIYENEPHQVTTRRNEYVNLMMLIYDRFADEEFGDCRGMGKCGTCMVEILNATEDLASFDRNEKTTLAKMNISEENVRLSCQLMIDDKLNGLQIRVL